MWELWYNLQLETRVGTNIRIIKSSEVFNLNACCLTNLAKKSIWYSLSDLGIFSLRNYVKINFIEIVKSISDNYFIISFLVIFIIFKISNYLNSLCFYIKKSPTILIWIFIYLNLCVFFYQFIFIDFYCLICSIPFYWPLFKTKYIVSSILNEFYEILFFFVIKS